jgi:prenyl protein peptidase
MLDIVVNLSFAAIFVGSLYFTPLRIRNLSHDNPIQIKQRAWATLFSCVVCCLIVIGWCNFFVLPTTDGTTTDNDASVLVHELLGVRGRGFILAAVVPLLLTATLFFGALVCRVCEYVEYQKIDSGIDSNARIVWPTVSDMTSSVVKYFSDWPNVRTVVLAPITEEFVFRSCMAAVLLRSGTWSSGRITFVLPLFFGVAHAHHFYRRVFLENTPLKRAVLMCVFQFTYTSLFGIYATFVYLRTGHLIAAVLCHCFCNWNGFPDTGWLTNKHDIARPHMKVIGLSYVVGIVGFYFGLYKMTDPAMYESRLWQH